MKTDIQNAEPIPHPENDKAWLNIPMWERRRLYEEDQKRNKADVPAPNKAQHSPSVAQREQRWQDRALTAEALACKLSEALRDTGHDLADVALWLKCPESSLGDKLRGIELVLLRNQSKRNATLAAYDEAAQ